MFNKLKLAPSVPCNVDKAKMLALVVICGRFLTGHEGSDVCVGDIARVIPN